MEIRKWVISWSTSPCHCASNTGLAHRAPKGELRKTPALGQQHLTPHSSPMEARILAAGLAAEEACRVGSAAAARVVFDRLESEAGNQLRSALDGHSALLKGVRAARAGPVDLGDLMAYARRISYRTAPPLAWEAGVHFIFPPYYPPAPLDDTMKAGVLPDFAKRPEGGDAEAGLGASASSSSSSSLSSSASSASSASSSASASSKGGAGSNASPSKGRKRQRGGGAGGASPGGRAKRMAGAGEDDDDDDNDDDDDAPPPLPDAEGESDENDAPPLPPPETSAPRGISGGSGGSGGGQIDLDLDSDSDD